MDMKGLVFLEVVLMMVVPMLVGEVCSLPI
jgi:hypothetical protein